MVDKGVILRRLLRWGFYPRELPPVFQVENFCSTVYENEKILLPQADFLSSPVVFDGITYQGKHRMFGVIHPINYAILSQHISEHWSEISSHLAKSQRSAFPIFFPSSDDVSGRSFIPGSFARKEAMGDAISSSYPMTLDLDINRFYGSIYTHSIPWAVLGKEEGQKRYKDGTLPSHWSSTTDKLVRACNSNQTLGIPIGPDTSRIVSEMILTQIDLGLDEFVVDKFGAEYFHNIDDYKFGSMSVQECDTIKAAFEREIRKFELRSRDDKAHVSEAMANENHAWMTDLKIIEVLKGQEFLDALFSTISAWRKRSASSNILGYCLSRYSKRIASFSTRKGAISHLQRLLFSVPWAVGSVAPLFICLKGADALSAGQVRLVRFGIDEGYRRHDIVTILWYLYICLHFKNSLDVELFRKCYELDCPLVDLMLAHLEENGLICDTNASGKLSRRYGPRSLSSTAWIYLYETERRGWRSSVEDDKIKKAKSNKGDAGAFFLFAKRNDVSFYNIAAFGVDAFSWRLERSDFEPSDAERVRAAFELDETAPDGHAKLVKAKDPRGEGEALKDFTSSDPGIKKGSLSELLAAVKSGDRHFSAVSEYDTDEAEEGEDDGYLY